MLRIPPPPQLSELMGMPEQPRRGSFARLYGNIRKAVSRGASAAPSAEPSPRPDAPTAAARAKHGSLSPVDGVFSECGTHRTVPQQSRASSSIAASPLHSDRPTTRYPSVVRSH